MKKALISVLLGLSVLTAWTPVLAVSETITIRPATGKVLQPVIKSAFRAPCTMNHTTNTAMGFWHGYTQGMRTVSYFDPAVCGSPVYPFELTHFNFVLWDDGGYQWPVTVDVVVFEPADPTDSCAGPGNEICRFSVECDSASFAFPNAGSAPFPFDCCVDGPFYMGLEYTDPGPGPFPSVMVDTSTTEHCFNWMYYSDSLWYEWYNFWGAPIPGYPMYWVQGETQSINCAPVERLAINEVRSFEMRGPAGERFNNFVELYNAGDTDIDLDDYTIRGSNSVAFVNLPPWTMPAGTYLTVTFGSGTDDSDFSDGVGSYFTQADSIGVLSEDEDEIGLYKLGTIVDFVCWSGTGSFTGGTPYSDALSAGIWTAGEFVDVSNIERFSTIGLCPSGVDNDVPSDWRFFDFTYFTTGLPRVGNPIQRYPSHGSSISAGENLYWASVAYAAGYQIEIDDDSTFGSPDFAVSQTDTFATVPVLADGFYYWRVKVDDGSEVIDIYDVWEFYYDTGLKAPADTLLGVPQTLQHKDSKLLCITHDSGVDPACVRPGCDELAGDNGPWDGVHPTTRAHVSRCDHCGNYCGRASIQMINYFYATDDNLTQDHISYELNQDNVHPGNPEGDLGHERYAWIDPNEVGPALSWALNGHGTNPTIGNLAWATITAEVDAGHPIMILVPGHWMVLDGYRTRGGVQQVHIVDPWPAAVGAGGAQTGWHKLTTIRFVGYYTLAAGTPTGRNEIEEVLTLDTDNDGIMDFDEGLPGYPDNRPRRFQAKFNEADSDSDQVNDKNEIKNYTFHDQAGYHPGHENDALTFPDIDNDGLRAEHDCDTDNDTDFDGGEDINGDGHNPVPAPGDQCQTETCQFRDSEHCIQIRTDKDVYYLGENVKVVDVHGSRESHTFHANSTYHYEWGSTCLDKSDGDDIAWNGTITTNAEGHVNTKKIMTCLFPGEKYLYVDVLSDKKYSEPDNWDPNDCWECLDDWYHGWHPWYDFPYHNPTHPWPYFESPTICVDSSLLPEQLDFTVLTPWWWWCYEWPPVPLEHWYGIGIPALALQSEQIFINGNPGFVQRDDKCVFFNNVDFASSITVTQDLTELFSDPTIQWFGYNLPSYVPPDSLAVTSIRLSSPGTGTRTQIPVTIIMGNSAYGWSPTYYDTIWIDIGGPAYLCGDADASSGIDIDDVVYLINYIFAGGPPPSPLQAGDADCSGNIDIDDVVYLINYIFAGGPAPCDPDGNGIPDC